MKIVFGGKGRPPTKLRSVAGATLAAVALFGGSTSLAQAAQPQVYLGRVLVTSVKPLGTGNCGNTIVGTDPYVHPITLTDSDGSGATSLSSTCPAPPCGSWCSSAHPGRARIFSTASVEYICRMAIRRATMTA